MQTIKKGHKSILIPMDFGCLRRGCRLSPTGAEVGSLMKMMPVLSQRDEDGLQLTKVGLARGFKKACEMVQFNGLGHSAAIHTKSKALSEEFGRRVKAIRVIWNSPSTFGGIGNVYNSFLPSLTLGCGSYGHNSISDNVSAVNLLNIKKGD